MKRLMAASLLLVLTCSVGNSKLMGEPRSAPSEPPTKLAIADAPLRKQVTAQKLSPAARSATSAGQQRTNSQLLECVTESCRVNCSPRLEKRVRPKWCVNFKEPVPTTR